MKKIYEDDKLILVDTQNENKAFPIVAFYGKKEDGYHYLDGLSPNDLDNELEAKIRHKIYKYCVRIGFYKRLLQFCHEDLVSLENKNSDGKLTKRIEILRDQVEHLKEKMDFAERFYNGK